jgi:hypothetical protein
MYELRSLMLHYFLFTASQTNNYKPYRRLRFEHIISSYTLVQCCKQWSSVHLYIIFNFLHPRKYLIAKSGFWALDTMGICDSTILLMYYCTLVLLHYCATVLLYYCTTVPLFTALLYYRAIELQYHCATVLFYYWTIALLYYCTVLLYCTIVLLNYSTIVIV